jgi:hypothetical protein
LPSGPGVAITDGPALVELMRFAVAPVEPVVVGNVRSGHRQLVVGAGGRSPPVTSSQPDAGAWRIPARHVGRWR